MESFDLDDPFNFSPNCESISFKVAEEDESDQIKEVEKVFIKEEPGNSAAVESDGVSMKCEPIEDIVCVKDESLSLDIENTEFISTETPIMDEDLSSSTAITDPVFSDEVLLVHEPTSEELHPHADILLINSNSSAMGVMEENGDQTTQSNPSDSLRSPSPSTSIEWLPEPSRKRSKRSRENSESNSHQAKLLDILINKISMKDSRYSNLRKSWMQDLDDMTPKMASESIRIINDALYKAKEGLLGPQSTVTFLPSL